MDTLLVVALHSVGYVGHVEYLIKRAVQTHDVVIAWITPAAAAQSDGVAVHALDVVAGEVHASHGGRAVEDDAGDGAHRKE